MAETTYGTALDAARAMARDRALVEQAVNLFNDKVSTKHLLPLNLSTDRR